MNILFRKEGFIKPLLVILLIAFACYAGFQFGIPYYRHSALKTDAVELARISLGQDEKLRNQIMERARELNIPLSEEDAVVERRSEKSVFVSLAWTEDVNILGLYHRTLEFTIEFIE